VSRTEVKGDGEKGDNSHPKEVKYGEATKKKTEVQTSTPTKKRMGTQEAEIRKKMKYHKNPPTITITEDDAELVADKVQDRGEDVVRATEAQREEIMEKLVEVHDILQRLQLNTVHHPTMQQKEKTQEASVQKEKEETVKTIVVSSDRFKVTQEMLEVDENTMQRPVKDVEHMELVLVNIPHEGIIWTTSECNAGSTV
jgi:hypothetical protein